MDTLSLYIQFIISGLTMGTIYAMVGIGFSFIYRVTTVLNFAQGDLLVLGAFVCWSCIAQLHIPTWASFLVVFIYAIAFGFLLERLILRHMIGQSLIAIIMMTIVLSIALRGVTTLAWGAEIWGLNIFGDATVKLAGAVFSETALWAFALSLLGMMVFYLYFQRTKMGLAMRAVAEDHQSARGVGVNINAVFSSAWIIAAIVGGLAWVFLRTRRSRAKGW